MSFSTSPLQLGHRLGRRLFAQTLLERDDPLADRLQLSGSVCRSVSDARSLAKAGPPKGQSQGPRFGDNYRTSATVVVQQRP